MVLFDAETGALEIVAPTLPGWAEALLTENYWSGWSLGQAWQAQHGPLPLEKRLMPSRLFVLGGKYEVDNLRAVDTVESLRVRGDVARQLRDLPDGTEIELRVLPVE
ncbi:hypothetical protein ACFSC4_09890 [Deinococcus malanensis]|uniref:hypothetical protein n=1 Tax=Deinococcus malanensis TaxID=1706855 RepID=UPI003627C92F